MKFIKQTRKFFILLILPFSILLTYVASHNPNYIESNYSNVIYTGITPILSRVTGIFPFSIGEFLFILIIVLFIYSFIRTFIQVFQNHNKKSILLNFFINVLVFMSILYFAFVSMWGLNYYRLPFSKIANLHIEKASTYELALLCKDLIFRANNLRQKIHENSQGVMSFSNGYSHVFDRAHLGYARLSSIYPELSGKYGKPKGIHFSNGMSYMGLSGIYCPFTGEANVNILAPASLLPSTTCHEMAHQRGFSREDEANYIAYLVCNFHPDVDFQYSGTLLALIHSMNMLSKYDQDQYKQLVATYSDGISRDLAAIRTHWEYYEGPIEKASTKLNNAYLKSNRQSDGVQSYGRMVDLLIAEYKKTHKNNNI